MMATQSTPNVALETSVTESNVILIASLYLNNQKFAEVDFCSRADADVKLVIASTERIAHFHVSSQVLCVASPVFKAMLGTNSKFREATKLAERRLSDGLLEIQLGDDNPNALAVILWAIHCRSDMVPPTLTQDRLYEIAIIVDKYDMACSVNFISKQWIQQLDPLKNERPLDPMWLFMAFAFQVPEIFERASKEAILHSTISSTGDLKFKVSIDEEKEEKEEKEKELASTPRHSPNPLYAIIERRREKREEPLSPSYLHVPQRILTQIANIRSQVADKIFDEAELILEGYSKFTGSQCEWEKYPSIRKTCDAIMFGLCSSAFRNGGILDATFPTSCSLNYLLNSVQGMKGLPHFFLADMEFSCCENPRLTFPGSNCSQCGKRYSRAVDLSTHTGRCSPIPWFQKMTFFEIEHVKGLDLKDFIRPSEGRTPANPSFDGLADLWESLVYTDVA